MGERVTRPGSEELARAERLKKALESGAAPAFLPPENSATQEPASVLPPLSWSRSGNKSDQVRLGHLEHLFQNVPDALAIEATGSGVLCVNDAFRQMFGYPANEVLGCALSPLIVPAEREAENFWLAECLERGEKIAIETQRRTKDGAVFDVSICSTPIVLDGKTTAVHTIYRDISRCKQAEALNSALYRVANISNTAKNLQQFFAAVHSICLLYTSPSPRDA